MRLGLILGEVAQGFRRNLSMVVSVILVTFISLTFFGAAILAQFQINQMKGYWYDRAEVAIMFCSQLSPAVSCGGVEATQDQIDDVEEELTGATLSPYIEGIEFEDLQEAYENALQQYEGTDLEDLITIDIMWETYRVDLVDPDQAEIIVDQISGMAGVEQVNDQRELLQPVFDVINAISVSAVGVAAVMLITAVLLIATTIRLSAFSRRREISIMRLVGASNRFIQTPFILEGVLAGLIGAALAGGAIVALVQFFVRGYLASGELSVYGYIGIEDAFLVVPILLASGALLAALSASVAIRRYLKA